MGITVRCSSYRAAKYVNVGCSHEKSTSGGLSFDSTNQLFARLSWLKVNIKSFGDEQDRLYVILAGVVKYGGLQ